MKHRYRNPLGYYLFVYTIAFMMICGTLAALFARQGLSFVGIADPLGQSLPVFAQQWRLVHGLQSFSQFDYTIGLGEDRAFVLYCFGLYNPLHFLVTLLPFRNLATAYQLCLFLKLYLAGLSFAYYVYRRRGGSVVLVVGALLYVFSNYLPEYGLYFFCFFDWAYTLPLLLVGVDDVLRGQRKMSPALLAAVVWQALNGFYFLYMQLLVAAFYVLIYSLLLVIEELIGANRTNKALFWEGLGRKWALLLGNVVLSLGLSSPVFIPGAYAFFIGNRGGGSFGYGVSDFLPQAERVVRFFMKLVTPNQNITGFWPMVVVPLLVVLFVNPYKNRKVLAMLGLAVVADSIPFVGSMLNGFSYETDRGSLFVIFAVAYGCCAGLTTWKELLAEKGKKAGLLIVGTLGVCLVYFLGIWVLSEPGHRRYYAAFMMAGMAVAALLLVGVRWLRGWMESVEIQRRISVFGRWVVLLIVLGLEILHVQMMFGSSSVFGGLDYAAASYVKKDYLAGIVSVDAIKAKDTLEKDFYRSDYPEFEIINESVMYGYPGTLEYFSIINDRYLQFVQKVGVQAGGSFSIYGFQGWKALEDLFSVKYYSLPGDKNTILENTEDLPLGIFYGKYEVLSEESADRQTSLQRYGSLLDRLIVPEKWAVESGMYSSPVVRLQSNVLEQSRDQIQLALGETGDEGEYFLKLTNLQIGLNAKLYTDGVEVPLYPWEEELVCKLPTWSNSESCADGRKLSIDLVVETEEADSDLEEGGSESSLQTASCEIWYYPKESYLRSVNTRREKTDTSLAVGKDCISGKVHCQEEGFLLLTIPYSKGWTAQVDGEKVDLLEADFGMMAIPVDEGSHEVELFYRRPTQLVGWILGCISVMILLAVALCNKRMNMRIRNV